MQYSELRTRVRDRLTISTSDAAKTTQIDDLLNQEYRRIVAKYAMDETVGTLDFTADTETVSLPTDTVRILSIRQGKYVLQPVTRQRFAEYAAVIADGASIGTGPQVYVRDGHSATIRVFPTPTETATGAAAIYYTTRPALMSLDADEPDYIPWEYHELIAERAIEKIALAEEDDGQARAAAEIAALLESDLNIFMRENDGDYRGQIELDGYVRRR